MAAPVPALPPALADVLTRSGARAVRLVDGRTGQVVGSAGDPDAGGADDPATVAGLVRDALASGQRGLDDVVVTTDRSMHVLRPVAVPGVFLHLRLGLPRADVVRARRALAAPELHAAIRAALGVPPDAGPPDARMPDARTPDVRMPDVRMPAPRIPARPERSRPREGRPPAPLPAPGPDPRTSAQQPALAGLVAERAPAEQGTRAAGVLAELIEVSPLGASLPRRRPATRWTRPSGGVTVGLPERVWARDVDTMRRLVLGLRRLS